MCVRKRVCVQVHVSHHMRVEVRRPLSVRHLLPPWWRRFPAVCWSIHQAKRPGIFWGVSGLACLSTSHLTLCVQGLQMCYQVWLYTGSGDLHSVPQACAPRTSPTQYLPQFCQQNFKCAEVIQDWESAQWAFSLTNYTNKQTKILQHLHSRDWKEGAL